MGWDVSKGEGGRYLRELSVERNEPRFSEIVADEPRRVGEVEKEDRLVMLLPWLEVFLGEFAVGLPGALLL